MHHIGSTSVPGLSAKPTIDIVLEVKNIDQVDKCDDQIEKLEYKE
ncbi:GrpB family protein [Candidatus Coxiella mudrowiae]|nr:GrpB family protein [Candidatus Coxiella mudrowiae]